MLAAIPGYASRMKNASSHKNLFGTLGAAALLLLGGALAHGSLRAEAQTTAPTPVGMISATSNGAYVLQNGRVYFCRQSRVPVRRAIGEADTPIAPVCSSGTPLE